MAEIIEAGSAAARTASGSPHPNAPQTAGTAAAAATAAEAPADSTDRVDNNGDRGDAHGNGDFAGGPVTVDGLDATADVAEAEATDEVDQAEDVDEVGEAEPTREVGEAEATREVGEAQAIREVGETEAIREVGEAQAIREVDEAEATREVGEAEDVDEVDEAEPTREVGAPQDVDEIDEADGTDEVDEVDEVDVYEEADDEDGAVDEVAGEAVDGRGAGTGSRSEELLVREGDLAGDYLERLLDLLDYDGDIDLDVEAGRAIVSIDGGDDLQKLVGQGGTVLEALQELTRLAVQQETGVRSRLMLDIAQWRAGRRSELAEIGREAAQKALSTGGSVKLAAMTPFERKIVHDAVAKVSGVHSESEGEEPRRRVVVFRTD